MFCSSQTTLGPFFNFYLFFLLFYWILPSTTFTPRIRFKLLAVILERPSGLTLPTSLHYLLQVFSSSTLGRHTGLVVFVKGAEQVPDSRPLHILCRECSLSDSHRAHFLAQISLPQRCLSCPLFLEECSPLVYSHSSLCLLISKIGIMVIHSCREN